MIYERYEMYERKMLKVSRILGWIKKYYKVAILPPVIAIALSIVFLCSIGTVMGDIACPDCSYGMTPEFEAKAFLANAYYEYSPADGNETWSTELPQRAGEYKIRVVSKNGFGKIRYSESAFFNVLPVEITFDYNKINCVYGNESDYIGEGIVPQGLIEGDRLEDVKCSFETQSSNSVKVSASSFRILNENGEDVTSSYVYLHSSGEWVLEKRKIELSSGMTSSNYNGTNISNTGEFVSSGSLVKGDSIKVVESAYLTNAGSTKNTFTARIVNENGEDVTNYYSISYNYGTLTVNKRNIQLATSSAEKVYDGRPLMSESYELIGGSLCDGHTIDVSYADNCIDVGTYDNVATVKITDKNGNDVSSNYNVSIQPGSLIVTPITLTVESGSAKRQYNGQQLTKETFALTSGKLLDGHMLSAVYTQDDAIYVGDYKNEFVCKIKSEDGKDVSSNYNIEYSYGVLTVEPIILKIRTGSAEKIYDGEPLTNKEWKFVSGKLFTGHNFFNTYANGARVDAGRVKNGMSIFIVDESGMDVTNAVYKIEVDCGTLTVKPRKVVITSESASKKYDGKPLTNDKYWWSYSEVTKEGLLNNHYPRSSFSGSQTEVGSSPNTFTATAVESSSGKDVSSNYEFVYQYGTLTVYPDDNMHEHEESEDYNIMGPMPEAEEGEGPFAKFRLYSIDEPTRVYLREKSYGDYTGSGWKKAVSCDINIVHNPQFLAGSQLHSYPNVSSHLFTINMADFCPTLAPYYMHYNQELSVGFTGNDVKMEFSGDSYSTYIAPDIEIPFNIQPGYNYNSWVKQYEPKYRKFVYENYLSIPDSTKSAMLDIAAANGIKANSKNVILDVKEYISHAAVYKLDIEEFPNGVDKAVYFLTVTKEGYCQHFASAATLMYRALGIPARYTVGFASTAYPGNQETSVVGDDAHAWVEVYIDGTGWIPVEVTAAVEGTPDPENADQRLTPDGRIMITVSTYSADKYYDGEAIESLSGNKYWVSVGSLLAGHRIVAQLNNDSTYFSYVGSMTNILESCMIYDANGKDVTDMYYINYNYGVSEIYKRPITIMSASASKVYDGTPLTDNRYWIVGGSLVSGHQLEVDFTGSQTTVGSSRNNFTYKIKNKYGGNIDYYYDITVIKGDLVITEK